LGESSTVAGELVSADDFQVVDDLGDPFHLLGDGQSQLLLA
jgi:hypothetical protein